MKKLLVLQGFRDIHTKQEYVPNTVIDMTEERAAEIVTNLGRDFVAEVQIVEQEAEGQDPEFPKHTGGGYYELSDGTKVQGKEAAIEAEQALAEE